MSYGVIILLGLFERRHSIDIRELHNTHTDYRVCLCRIKKFLLYLSLVVCSNYSYVLILAK